MITFHLLTFIFKFYENTSSQDVMFCFFFSSSISAVSQLFETCCGFDFFQLPPVMKITLIACLWNIQSETEYAVTITNRWRLTFYIPCYSISSFLWIFVVVFFPEARISFEVMWSLFIIHLQGHITVRKKACFSFKQSVNIYWASIVCQTLVVENTDVNLSDWVLPL